MSMDRMKYLSTDFLVYQLLERKVIFLNTRRLDCFGLILDQQREKLKHRIDFLFVPRTTIR